MKSRGESRESKRTTLRVRNMIATVPLDNAIDLKKIRRRWRAIARPLAKNRLKLTAPNGVVCILFKKHALFAGATSMIDLCHAHAWFDANVLAE